jgi:hypothetical protein
MVHGIVQKEMGSTVHEGEEAGELEAGVGVEGRMGMEEKDRRTGGQMGGRTEGRRDRQTERQKNQRRKERFLRRRVHVPTLLVDLAKQLPSVGPSRHVHHHGAGRLSHLFWLDDGRAFQGDLVTHVLQHNTNVLFGLTW